MAPVADHSGHPFTESKRTQNLHPFPLRSGLNEVARLRRETTKGKKARMVLLWWDAGALEDLRAWKVEWQKHGAKPGEAFVCSVQSPRRGDSLQRHAIRRRFLSACKILGLPRLRTLTIHHGRHTFISHALAGGRTLADVRLAAGHSNVAVTSVYLHVAVEDEAEAGDLFAR